MAQKGETLVEVKDLCKNFGVTIALSHVDFVVKTGEIRGLRIFSLATMISSKRAPSSTRWP